MPASASLIARDGALIGAEGNDGDAGAAWVYTLSGSTFTQQKELPPTTITIPPAAPATPPTVRLNPTIGYTFRDTRTYTVLEALSLSGVPSAAQVDISCSGRHCPFKARVARVPDRKVCTGKGKRRRCVTKPPPRVGTVTLTSLFHHRHLSVGTKLTIRVVQSGTIGKVYVLTIRRSRGPALKTSCLAPGSTVPGRAC